MCALDGAFFATGQRCTASSRIIVQDGIYKKFVEALTEKTLALTVGDALDPASKMGPGGQPASSSSRNLSYVDIAVKEGGRLTGGGQRLTLAKPGYYMSPAVIADTQQGMRINGEEVFGPVASILRVKDYDEALAVANAGEFGLSAGICTSSLKYAPSLPARGARRHGDGESADRRRRLSRAVRRIAEIELWCARTGLRGGGILYSDENGLFLA